MKKFKVLLIPVLFGMLLSGCTPTSNPQGGGGSGGEVAKDPELNITEKTIKVDDEFDLIINNVPDDVTPIWSQQGNAITFQLTSMVRATSAKVKGVSAGQATLTIVVGEKTLTCRVTVENKVEPKKYATISIEANEHMTTSLKAGSNYELNQAIEFTVSPINEEYNVASVKMNDTELTPANGKYTFTPTEEKEYKLKVTTEELTNKIVFTFESLKEDTYVAQLTRKGVRVNVDNAGYGFDEMFKNGNLVYNSGKHLVFLCQETSFGGVKVLIRKIEFSFVDNKNNLELGSSQDDKSEYSDGVWTSKATESDEGDTTIVFNTTGDVIISKLVITTTPFVQTMIKPIFTNLGDGEKVYYFNGPNFEEWQKKVLVTSDLELVNGQDYYLYVEWNQYHKDYFDNLAMFYKETPLHVSTFYPSEESGLPQKEIVCYMYRPAKEESKTNTIELGWAPKEASKEVVIDIDTANKYVKGFMETEPNASLGLGNFLFGKEVILDLKPKKGYIDLKMIVNGVTISPENDSDKYKFTAPFAKPISISFAAKEGSEDTDGREVIALTGDNKDKGCLVGDFRNDQFFFIFLPDDNHPTATLTSISFNEAVLEKHVGEEEREYYLLTKEQTTQYRNASDKSALFSVTLTENPTYTSSLSFNKGAFKVEIADKTPTETDEGVKYEIAGKSSVTVKITPEQYLDIHSVEVNDKRLAKEQYTLDPTDGSVTYTFTANALNYDFLIQTKPQTVQLELDNESTSGYKIKDLPTTPSEVGKPLTLTLMPSDDSHWLEGKKITVTYNGVELPVDENNFTFVVTPVKGVSKIKVIVIDKPAA